MHVHRIDFHATNISMKSLLYETRFCDAANVRFLSKQFHLLLVFVHKRAVVFNQGIQGLKMC